MYAAESFHSLNHGVKAEGETERVSQDNNEE